jgi:hypothetical protein
MQGLTIELHGHPLADALQISLNLFSASQSAIAKRRRSDAARADRPESIK